MTKNRLEMKAAADSVKYADSIVVKKSAQEGSDSAGSAEASKMKNPRILMQHKKEETAQLKDSSMPSQSKIRADAARKRLDRYMKSDERKQWQKKQRDNLYAQSLLTGITDGQWTPEQDETEKRLSDEVKHWENQEKLERDAETLRQGMSDIEAMSEEDRAAFNKYAEKGIYTTAEDIKTYEGLKERYGDRLDDLVKVRERNLNQQRAQKLSENAAARTESTAGKVLHAPVAVAANIVGGVTGTAARINEAFQGTGPFELLDANTLGDLPSIYAETVKDQTISGILGGEKMKFDDGISGRELGALAYQGVMGAAETGGRLIATGGNAGLAATLAATQSWSSTIRDATAKGATPAQAYALATINSGIEAATEKLPLDELFKVARGGAKPAAQIVANVLKQMGVEIAEEEASLIGTTLAEAAILREKSSYNQQVMEAVLGGATYEEARAQANHALLAEAINTALVSGVSGAVSAGGAEYHAARHGGTEAAQQSETKEIEERQKLTEGTEQAASAEAEQPDLEQAQMDALLEGIHQKQEPQKPSEDADWMRQTFEHNTEKVDVQGSQADTDSGSSVRTQIRENQDSLNAMDPVASIRTPPRFSEMPKSDRKAWVINKLRSTNYKVDRKGFGIIKFAEKQLKSAFNYLKKGSIEEASFEALPYVLEHGTQISSHPVHKGREYGTVTFAAPVVINGKRGNMAVVVKQTTENFYKVHRILTPDGSVFNLSDTTNEAGSSLAGESPETGSLATPINPASDNSVPQNGAEVNGNIDESGVQGEDIQSESAEHGQIKGTGAAERGFTPKQAAINEYGNIPEGENPVRPDQLPASTDGTDRVSYTARTALEARVTPDEFVPLIENETMQGGFSFIPIHNDDTTRAATESISREGWQTARANWTANVRAGITSPEITATGALLYNHALNAGDHQEAMDVLLDYQMAVRNTARSLQAARILKTLTPSDRLYMIRRSVDAMVQDMGLDTPVTIDENLAQQYQQAGTQEEADEILDQIAENVARQIPATRMEAFTALRYLNMLGNFRTQGRNIAGNIGSKVVYGVKDKVATGIEMIAHHLSGGRVERTKSFVADRSTQQAAAADYETVRDWVLGGGRYNDHQTESDDFARRVQDRRRILPPGLEQYRRATQRAMDAGDEIFTRSAYSRALAGYLNARGIRTNDLESVDPDILDRAREYAVRQAQEQTFRDNNQISDFVGGILRGRNTPAWARVIGEGIMPFRKTPANVLVRAEEFSPLGVVNSLVNTVRAARGQITGAELIDSWAKTLTGTALFALGMGLFDMGVLSGGPDEDEEKAAFDHLNGMQDYAITVTVDGKPYSYTIDWATPAAMPLFLGAQMQKAFAGKEDLTWADLEKVLTSVGDPLIQMSMLQGVNDTLENVRYAENNLGQFLINATMSYLTQGLTNTLLGQIEKSTEDTRQTTYVDKDSNVPQWLQKQLGKASQKIPGWDYQQTDYINARGETEEQRTDALGWVYNLVSPGYVDKVEIDDVSKELYRLNDAGIEGNVFPESPSTTLTWTDKTGKVHKDDHLTPEQAETLKRETGQISMRIVESMISSKDYAAMSDEQKAKAIQQAYQYARKTGEIAAIGDNHTGYDEPWMMDLDENKEADQILRRVIKSQLANAVTALNTAWDKGYDEQSRSDEMKWVYDTFNDLSLAAKKQIKRESESSVVNYLEARESGISHEKYVDVAKLLDGIVPEAGYNNPRPIQKAETIVKSRGLTEGQKELLIKQQVSDSQDKNIDELNDLGYGVDAYVKLYRDYEGYTHGNGKKKRTARKWSEEFGISMDVAYKLYEVFP